MTTYLSKYKRNSIVRLWKCGIAPEEIADITEIPKWRVMVVIKSYFKNTNPVSHGTSPNQTATRIG